jgi:cytoskeletal protein RodZ
METIGRVLKEARVKKRYSRARLEKETKIKKEFIEALEKEDWGKLPDFPVIAGFAKNIAQTLKINNKRAAALLRRDYPPKVLPVAPKPDVSKGFSWSPRLTFLLGLVIVSLAVLSYLTFQYLNFISPPALSVFKPEEGMVVKQRTLEVAGKTDPDAVIRVNNQPVLVNEKGEFAGEIEIFEGTHQVEVKATSRSGKETTIRRKIVPELNDK